MVRDIWKRVLLFGLPVVFLMSCGCTAMVSRMLLGTEDTSPKKHVLSYQESITTKGLDFYGKALDKVSEEKVTNKGIVKIANLVDDELNRKGKAGGTDKFAMVGNTMVRMMEQPQIKAKVEEGFQFGMNALTMAISGGIGGTGILGTIIAKSRKRIRKEVLKNRIKTKVLNENPEILAKVKKEAENTEVEAIIT